jgi:peptidyl-dipeptidase Dcp
MTQEENTITDISTETNPFLIAYNTPFKVPPFDKVKPEHFMPAFEEGMKQNEKSILDIISQDSAPTFENTIEKLETSDELLTKVSSVFFNLASANTSPEIEKISQIIAPKLSHHSDDIFLNADLFKRVKTLNDQQESLDLTHEQKRLLEKTYKAFVRSGANLNAEQQLKMREINKELSILTVQFGQNMLAETNNFELLVDNEADLAGLPVSLIASAAHSASEAG